MKTYYLFNPGTLSRRDNTLKFVAVDENGVEAKPKYIPINDVDALYVFGSLTTSSSLYNFLGKHQVSVHFFDYYEHYTGSFMPKEYLLAGKMQVEQTKLYLDNQRRFALAKALLNGAIGNILRNLNYYNSRGKDCQAEIDTIHGLNISLSETFPESVQELMGIEGNVRMTYYHAFDTILDGFEMGNRSKQPPTNEVNALISFINMLCYTACLDQIYHTQLNPTISFLHEPGARRYSLALDLAEIFKPILVDRFIFSLINRKQLKKKDFDSRVNGITIKENAKKLILKHWDQRLSETIKHPSLGRKVSYRHLIRLECYKLTKHILRMDLYKPYRIR